jgi:hypothetical protein
MEQISSITLALAGGLCLLAAVTSAHVDAFGFKFAFTRVWERWAVGLLGLLFIAGAWLYYEHVTKTPDCYVSGTATSSGSNSPASVSGCVANPEGGSKQ